MGIIARLEAWLERLFEAPAGRLGATLQPVLLTKRIERAMDTGKAFGAAGIIVPNRYDLHLHPADFAEFEPYRGSLEDDLAHGAAARARREHYHLVARPSVTLVADPAVPRGDVRVAANVVDVAGESIPEPMPAEASEHTMVLARPGHEPDNDVIVDDPEVSRHHCQLKLQHGAYSLADLGSRNGSWINGQPVSEVALGPGDVIRIGSTEIEFQVS